MATIFGNVRTWEWISILFFERVLVEVFAFEDGLAFTLAFFVGAHDWLWFDVGLEARF